MLNGEGSLARHEKFLELCALADSGSLTALELSELRLHLEHCEECRQALREYRVLATEGISSLAATYAERHELVSWDATLTRQQLLGRVREEHQGNPGRNSSARIFGRRNLLQRVADSPVVRMALAACIIMAVGYGGYRLGARAHARTASNPSLSSVSVADDRLERVSAEKKEADELLAAQAKELAELELQSSQKEQELEKLRSELRVLEDRSKDLAEANSQSEEQLQALSQQRDALNAQLQIAAQALQKNRVELANLETERDKTQLRAASLEAKGTEMMATNREQERRLKELEQYLSSDRDIRELMGARKLYIADVFDVDGSSHTQKPFGRVFYTQGKSLIFYAFDLDRQAKFVNASTFQVWGQREAPQGEQVLPTNLGILYMDSESNRRWMMRFDDAKQLAEIDAVFVTVEPDGGSPKPTSKPLLYALLRNQANHP